MRHLVYPLQTVLDDSLGCAIWFASQGKGTSYVHENGELVNIEERYTSSAKVCSLFFLLFAEFSLIVYPVMVQTCQ